MLSVPNFSHPILFVCLFIVKLTPRQKGGVGGKNKSGKLNDLSKTDTLAIPTQVEKEHISKRAEAFLVPPLTSDPVLPPKVTIILTSM